MTTIGWMQIALFALLILVFTRPTGRFMHKVFEGERTWLTPFLGPLEQFIYKLSGVSPQEEMDWKIYSAAMLAFSVVTAAFTYIVLRLQQYLPLNPEHFGTKHAPAWAAAVTPDLGFNTAVSFTTNTNWQAYGGESTLSYFSQMAGLASHMFFSAACGMAVAIALVRGLTRRNAKSLGNFWADITRSTVYVLLPLSLVLALFYVDQGVIMNFLPYRTVHTVQGSVQIIPGGPVASMEAIKELGTNGGGFFNANSAHPFENPTPLCNFVEMLTIFLLGAGLVYTFGIYAGDTRQGWALFGTMAVLFFIGAAVAYTQEARGNPLFSQFGINQSSRSLGDLGGNMEGKEVRFGEAASTLFATITTDASCGAVNSMHDSYTPLGGLVPMANILTGEVIFGGVGAGLYGMLMYAILAVFIAGLMVGRTPEYLGKKIEAYEVKMAMLATLILTADVLVFTAAACVMHVPHAAYWNAPGGTSTSLVSANTNNSGPHGFSEILYAFDSTTGNNGSAFAGINVNTPFWNLALGISMLAGRFLMMIPLLAIAGSMAAKKKVPASAGTFPTCTPLFAGLLLSTVIIVGALAYFPAVSLGPIVENVLMHAGRTF